METIPARARLACRSSTCLFLGSGIDVQAAGPARDDETLMVDEGLRDGVQEELLEVLGPPRRQLTLHTPSVLEESS